MKRDKGVRGYKGGEWGTRENEDGRMEGWVGDP